ncbi:MAG: response regulator [Cyanobacteria bacterium Co-bin13]|nr:response regulator [Cyanobacteria bacterium Co-bin13]
MLSESKVNILLVDDQPENLLALEAILEDLGQNLVRAMSGEAALRQLLHQDFAVILLDVQMPNMDGFEVASLIRSRERSRETPIIFLTAFSTTEQFMFRGYALGAVDYLIKPIATNVLKSKVSVFIELFKKNEALRQQAMALQQQTAQLETINTELQISEERFRSLSTCSPVGVFVTDPSGQCVYTNPRFQALCGLLDETCQDWLQTVHPDDQPEAAATWADYLQGKQEYSLEFRLRTPDPPPWGHIRVARMLSDQGKFLGHVGTIEDITERKQAEAAKADMIREQAAREEAEAANRMKDEFIAILSHELRTPLNAILGWTHLIRSRQCDERTIANALEIIERNAHSQAKLIEDILDVSQIVRGKLQLERHPVDLAAVANAALDTVRSLAEVKAIALVPQFDPNSRIEVVGDAMRLQQVIWNLLTNAVKFTPEQGRIEVRVSAVEAAAPGSAVAPALQRWAQVQVTDTGIGIEPEFLPYVFERFRQADSTTTRTHGGLGLGLAIVRHLVEQHEGIIQADSRGRNQGSTFTVRLPLQQELRQAPDQAPGSTAFNPSGQATSLAGVQVLIVDDDVDTLAFLTYLLRTEGAQVTTAASAVEALEILGSEIPEVLLCDISMPDMDGYTLVQKLRTQMSDLQAQIPAIALTAHARLSDQEQALAAGFQRHLAKPVEPAVLVQTVAQLARHWEMGG